MSRVFMMLTLLLAAAAVGAGDAPGPDPALAPERVVRIQLEALQDNDEPEPDAGIARTWAFAHPQNKQRTGPLERFTAMLKSPAYAPLIDHRSHTIERVERRDERAVFEVTVVAADGRVVTYGWVVAPVTSGEHAGAWMTIQVSPPLEQGSSV